MITKRVYAVVKSVPMEIVELELYYDPTTSQTGLLTFLYADTEDLRFKDQRIYITYSKITEEDLLSRDNRFYDADDISISELKKAVADIEYKFYKRVYNDTMESIDTLDCKISILEMQREQLSEYLDKTFSQMKTINPKLKRALATNLKFDKNGHPYTKTEDVLQNDIEDAEFRIKRGI